MSSRVSHLSGGAFDITVKPLVDLSTQEFARGAGLPSARAIAQSLQLVGYGQIEADAKRIAFEIQAWPSRWMELPKATSLTRA